MDIDTLFDRAVAIVQSLPKSGPIQTDYEDKLGMYSLYKQATVGNVSSPRPAIWDMLGRAKWDAWAKHREMPPDEAKRKYVESLRKVLRKYVDAEGAKELFIQLQMSDSAPGFGSNIEATSDDSGDSNSDEDNPTDLAGSVEQAVVPPATTLPYPSHLQHSTHSGMKSISDESSSDAESDHRPPPQQTRRPQSITSSQQRYRTPVGTTSPLPPPASRAYSDMNRIGFQPLPTIAAPSAFATNAPHQVVASAPALYQEHHYPQQFPTRLSGHGTTHLRSQSSGAPMERIIQHMQGHLAALTERLDRLEDTLSTSQAAAHASRRSREDPSLDLSHLGLWSIVLKPISRLVQSLWSLIRFLLGRKYANPPHPGAAGPNPLLVIIRRLLLDASFVLAAYTFLKLLWRKSSLRRREIRSALMGLWTAMIGSNEATGQIRTLSERGV